jgi:hypothetical protein
MTMPISFERWNEVLTPRHKLRLEKDGWTIIQTFHMYEECVMAYKEGFVKTFPTVQAAKDYATFFKEFV